MKKYKKLNELPDGRADKRKITDGCIVIEGGGWRGLYAGGVLDALMESDLNFQTAIGVSAGALFGVGYMTGQIGWASRIDLTYRNDPRYVGRGALIHEHSIMGLHYLFTDLLQKHPIDIARFQSPNRDLIVTATNLETGEPTYFSKNQCRHIFRAVIASASVPYVSRPIMINGDPYLDGGCSVKIAYDKAKELDFDKIVVVRTRDRGHRRKTGPLPLIAKLQYHRYPKFLKSLDLVEERYNQTCEKIQQDEAAGRTFVLAPTGEVDVSRFEKDLDKLGDLYFRGYHDTLARIPQLREYLES